MCVRGKRKREGSERHNDRKIAQEIQHILEVVQTTWDHAACVSEVRLMQENTSASESHQPDLNCCYSFAAAPAVVAVFSVVSCSSRPLRIS